MLFSTVFLFFACQPKPVGGVLDGTWWTLASTLQNSKSVAPQGGAVFRLRFLADQLSGNGPCNEYHADYTAEGVNLTLGEITVYDKMCDEIDQENAWLSLLSKAKTYSVYKDRLEIYCGADRLTFVPVSEAEVQALEFEKGTGKLAALFPGMEGGATPHLFPVLKVDNPGEYPYTGTLVDTAFYKYFDSESSGIWRETGGDVMAVGKLGDLYVCRVPGRYVSSDIALFRIVGGRMTHAETVAWAWCDGGWCNQQDAWLSDVDQDGKMDIIQHYTLTDDKGKIREERMTVLVQDEEGSFVENRELGPDKSKFEMARI